MKVTGDVAGLPRWDWVIVAGLLLVIAWAIWYRSRGPEDNDD